MSDTDLFTGRPGRKTAARGWTALPRGAGRGGRRLKMRDLIAIVALLGVAGAVIYVIMKPPASADGQTLGTLPGTRSQTSTGVINDTDRLLLVKVRQAGLWEMPTGQQAQQRATSPLVKQAGNNIAREHAVLDADVRQVAAQLKVVLPSEPNPQQKGWMAQLSKLQGPAYDKEFVHLLRSAHGNVFGIIAKVRANTENSVIRAFAERCLATVMRHMTYMESTGLTNYDQIHSEVH